MRKLLLLSLLMVPTVAGAQQTLFVPACSGTNDTAAFSALISSIGSNVGAISLPYRSGARCAVNSLRIPPNITLDNTQGSGIKVNTGQTLTVAGPISNPQGKGLFYNALAGQGTVSFSGNTALGQVLPQWWGAVADAQTDSTAAIQAAMDAAPTGGVVFFPSGSYRTTSALIQHRPLSLRGSGATPDAGISSGTKLGGSINDYLVKFPLGGFVGGTSVEDIYLTNKHPTGGGLYFSNGGASTRFKHLLVEAYRAITITQPNFTVLVEDVRLKSTAVEDSNTHKVKVPPGSWGIYTRGHTQIISADVVNFDHGIRAAGAGISILGGRYEVNNTAILLGMLDDGTQYPAADVSITGFTMEANDIGIHIRWASGYMISAFSIQGTTGSPSGQSVFGIFSETTNSGVIQGGGPGGSFSKAAIRTVGYNTFLNVGAENDNALGQKWDVRLPQTATFVNTNYQVPREDDTGLSLTGTQFVRSLGAADYLRGLKKGNNLRGINIPVTPGATSVEIAFPFFTSGHAHFRAADAAEDGASTLAPATYYYNPTIITELGETAASGERSVVVEKGRRATFLFYGVDGKYKNWRRRVYRGTSPGVYDGYFDLPPESSAPFSDSGQAFTGKQPPPPARAIQLTEGMEPDEVYAVVVVPSWNAGGVWVTNKSKAGFVVNFNNAPQANATLDWILIR